MAKFLSENVVTAALSGNGAKFVSVTFEKVNGEVIKRSGQRAASRRIGNEKGKAQAARMAVSKQVWLDYPQEKISESGRLQKGFSFNKMRVVKLKVNGQSLSANGE